MGCATSRPIIEEIEEDDLSYRSDETYRESSTESSVIVTNKLGAKIQNPKGLGVGISGLVFSSDKAIKLSNPLFASRYGSIYKSQVTFSDSTAFGYFLPVTEVTSQLFFGSFDDAKDEKNLRELGVTHIISLIGPKHIVKGIKHLHKPMNDYGRTDLKKVMQSIWGFVLKSQKPGNKLFLHCQSGQNRSATVMISILLKLGSESDNLADVYRLVKKKRPVVQINEKYAKQLIELEKDLFGFTSMPRDWMKISSYNMGTGNVTFYGDESSSRCLAPHKNQKRNKNHAKCVVDFSAMQYDLPNSSTSTSVESCF